MDPNPRGGEVARSSHVADAAGIVRVGQRYLVLSPLLDASERARVRRAARRWCGTEVEMVDSRAVFLGAVASVGWLGIVLMSRGWVLVVLLLVGVLAAANIGRQVWRRAGERREFAELRSRVVVPHEDLHPADQPLLRTVADAVVEVASSRAEREGHLGDGVALLTAEQWRIANAMARLAEARRLLGQGGLPEHTTAVAAAGEAVQRRVRRVQGYAEAVRRVDRTLAAVDAAVRSDSIHDKVRDAIAALGDDQPLASLVRDAGAAEVSVEAALDALRGETDALRSLPARVDDGPA